MDRSAHLTTRSGLHGSYDGNETPRISDGDFPLIGDDAKAFNPLGFSPFPMAIVIPSVLPRTGCNVGCDNRSISLSIGKVCISRLRKGPGWTRRR